MKRRGKKRWYEFEDWVNKKVTQVRVQKVIIRDGVITKVIN